MSSSPHKSPPVSASWVWPLPKAELHLHLDTSLRPETAMELAPSRKVALKAGEDLIAPHDSASLIEVLRCIDPAIAILQDLESLERCAQELAEDLVNDGVVYAEIRFAPELHTKKGLKERQIIEAVWKGLGRGQYKNLRTRLIVCALRHMPAAHSVKAARVALENRDQGVIAFDLAGDENAQPASAFHEAYSLARVEGLALTAHAGEAAGPESVIATLDALGPKRIGHGVRSITDPALMKRLKEERIALETCPSSNLITKAVKSWQDHPAPEFLAQGLLVTINTDARTLIRTTLTDELVLLARARLLSRQQVSQLIINSFEAAFDAGPYKQDWIRYVKGAS